MLPGLFFLKAYPPDQIWRLFVDGRFWAKENGWQGYESRERGSINAALESLCSNALQVDKTGEGFELSVDFIKDIHKKCGRKVEELEGKNPGEIRTDEPVSFGIPASRASIKGIEEFLGLIFLIKGEAAFGPGKAGVFAPRFDTNYFKDLTLEQIPELAKKIYEDMHGAGHNNTTHFYLAIQKNVDVFLEAITQSYNKEIKVAKTLDEKLQVIAKHIRQYEVLHPFRDANGRTFVNNLLNILLMQQGLPPATFYEPNVFDLYSTDELVVVIKEAIFNTVEIIEKNKKGISLYGYSSTSEDTKKFMKMLDSPSYKKIQQIDLSHLNMETYQRNTQDCLSSLSEKYPLHRGAVYLSDPGQINKLISVNDAQINKRIEQGAPPLYVSKTPMHLAVMMGNSAMIDALIDKNADLSIQDYDGKTALHYAVESGNMQIMEKVLNTLLLQKGAPNILNFKDNLGKTVFHYAAEYGNPKMVSALISTKFFQINEPDSEGSSPITLAYKNHKLDIFEKLLNSGGEISQELLNTISKRKDIETFKKVIAKNEKILKSKEAFNIAISLGSVSIVKKFLQAGMDINSPMNKENATPLMLAVSRGEVKLAKYLLKKGANTSLGDASGDTALHYVSLTNPENREALIKLLIDKDKKLINTLNGIQQTPLFTMVIFGDVKMTQFLLNKGATINGKDSEGNTVLHKAMARIDFPMMKEFYPLLDKQNSKGRNPFHHALYNYNSTYSKEVEGIFIDLCDFLLIENIDLNRTDELKMTLLDTALSKDYYHLCVKLMKAGAHTNISAAAELLKNSESDSILEHPNNFEELLKTQLDLNPVIAMAQLNDLFIQIKNNNIHVPKGFAPYTGFAFFKGKPEDVKAHDKALSVLKDIYDHKREELLGERKDKKRQLYENLEFLINNQELSKKIEKPSVQVVDGETYKIDWS